MRHVHVVGDFILNKEFAGLYDKSRPIYTLDTRVLKNEREILQELQVESWLDLLDLHCTIVVKELERLVKMNKSIVEALVYVSSNSNTTLITCSRYSWFVFTFYSPFVEEHQVNSICNKHLKDDKCFGIVKSILNRIVGDDRGTMLAFEHLKGNFDYTTSDAVIAFKKFQTSAVNYLNSLGVFPGTCIYFYFSSAFSNFEHGRKIYDVCGADRLY